MCTYCYLSNDLLIDLDIYMLVYFDMTMSLHVHLYASKCADAYRFMCTFACICVFMFLCILPFYMSCGEPAQTLIMMNNAKDAFLLRPRVRYCRQPGLT